MADLYALDFEFHVVFPGGFSILAFLPAVAIFPVLHLLPVV